MKLWNICSTVDVIPTARTETVGLFWGSQFLVLSHSLVLLLLESGSTLLHTAVYMSDERMVRLIGCYGPHLRPIDKSGRTPADYASTVKLRELVLGPLTHFVRCTCKSSHPGQTGPLEARKHHARPMR
jgi:hypothetical protein